ncbi:MAG: hypothetical protein J5781_05565 [Clostridia bacterium]|nr:hypothetical protein [Clostridia bacterium]
MAKLKELEPFAYGYLHSKKKDVESRIASSITCYANNVPLVVDPKRWYVGHPARDYPMGVWFCSSSAISFDIKKARESLKRSKGKFLGVFLLLLRMFPRVTESIDGLTNPYKTQLMRWNKVLWGTGGGHGNPDYKLLLDLGTDGLRKRVKKYRAINPGKDDFYDALVATLDAFDILAARYKDKATEMLKTAQGEDKEALKRIVTALENIPQKSPRNFFEACQFFWLSFSFLEIDSPGLFDYTLGKYYEEDDTGLRYDCLKKLWEQFHETRTWNLCVGGSTPDGKDMCNELTYDLLAVAREYKYNTPNITMRFHKNSPEKAWNAAIETLATGIGMPAIYNDECVVPAMEKLGIPKNDAHLYCMNGCNQIDIYGKSHMGLEDGEFNVAKALEFVLYRGVCSYTKKKFGLDLGDPNNYATFDDFLNAFFKETDYMIDKVVAISNKAQAIYAKYGLNPWRSNLIEGCVERGLDYKNKGPLYGHGQILTEGLPDTADSLAAIKHFVYDEKKYTMKELVDALKKNYEGYDELYKDFSGYHKFGNDVDDVDDIYKTITHHIYNYALTKKTFRGGTFGIGCSTFQRAAEYGEHTGALPNGKKKEDTTFADSIGAVPGCDKNGPTALLNSVLKVDQTLAKSGNVLQMKFSKSQFNTEAGKEGFKTLAKTYFRMGGQTLQVNVVSREELLDAKAHPEKYPNLVVRVGGFSEYFVRLSPGLQDNIIKRTENKL